jgi:hypothetical protein
MGESLLMLLVNNYSSTASVLSLDTATASRATAADTAFFSQCGEPLRLG